MKRMAPVFKERYKKKNRVTLIISFQAKIPCEGNRHALITANIIVVNIGA